MKTGLVLEGGAMRGMFTSGVLDVLMENGVEFDGAVGVSAGACFGCNYKSRQPGRAIRYNLRFCGDSRYCSVRSFLKTGDLFGVDFCYGEIPKKLDVFDFEEYRKNPMKFYAVCTDVETGKAVYFDCADFEDGRFDRMRASASMPLVSRIVETEGKKLLDGGIADSVPIRFFEGLGYDRLVVILTQPRDYIKEKNPMLPLARIVYRKYPAFVQAMANRHLVYNETLDYVKKREADGAIIAIFPKAPLEVGRIEKKPERLKAVYEQGREIAAERLEEIKAFVTH